MNQIVHECPSCGAVVVDRSDGNQCRTPRLDEMLCYSLLVDNDCEAVFAGKQGEILKKSLWVEQRGVEPLDISKIKW